VAFQVVAADLQAARVEDHAAVVAVIAVDAVKHLFTNSFISFHFHILSA